MNVQLPDANLCTQFVYTMNHESGQMYKCCLQFNNTATIIFRQNVRYFATGRNDDR